MRNSGSWMSFLQLDAIACCYDGKEPTKNVVNNLSLTLSEGDIACLLGPSGCGKTTVLRAIAGFHALSAGTITLGDRLLSNAQFSEQPEQRQIGLVFQDYALFPHLTVYDNITFGLYRENQQTRKQVCTDLLDLVQLSDLANRYPHELSGGQQQRVALARALAARPRLLLLDEPFSNLDVELRRSLTLEVRSILKKQQITAIMVTHDQEEAFAFADHIGVMQDGELVQWDTPYNLYHCPADPFVASFIGQGVLIPGAWQAGNILATELGQIEYDFQNQMQGQVDVLLRPDDIVHSPSSPISGRVTDKIFVGTITLYTLALNSDTKVIASFPSHLDFTIGQQVPISLELKHPITFHRSAP